MKTIVGFLARNAHRGRQGSVSRSLVPHLHGRPRPKGPYRPIRKQLLWLRTRIRCIDPDELRNGAPAPRTSAANLGGRNDPRRNSRADK